MSRRPRSAADPHNSVPITLRNGMRQTAERAIAKVWGPQHRACLISTSPRRADRKGRLTSGSEKKESRLRAFDEVRKQVLNALVAGDRDLARSVVENSEFAHALRLAFSPDEAATRLAEFLNGGDNAWCEGDAGESAMWICSWRE